MPSSASPSATVGLGAEATDQRAGEERGDEVGHRIRARARCRQQCSSSRNRRGFSGAWHPRPSWDVPTSVKMVNSVTNKSRKRGRDDGHARILCRPRDFPIWREKRYLCRGSLASGCRMADHAVIPPEPCRPPENLCRPGFVVRLSELSWLLRWAQLSGGSVGPNPLRLLCERSTVAKSNPASPTLAPARWRPASAPSSPPSWAGGSKCWQ